MKTVLAILLVIGILGVSWAQNYQLIYPNQEKHFNYTDNFSDPTIESIRIDSIAILGNNTYYHNHQILSQTSYTGVCDITINDSSWVGHQIIAQPDGDYLFFNQSQDSILIKTLANLNDSWVLYTFPNNDYIEATVTSISNASLLGVTDSIKTLVLQAKDNTNNNIIHPFNNQQITFSKNYGLVRFYAMNVFPSDTNSYTLVGSSNPNMGIVNLTAAEIFDYDIGDEFHTEDYYRSSLSPWQYTISNIRRIILDKTVSNNQDTLKYTVARCQNLYDNNNSSMTPDTTIVVDTITELIILSQHTYLNQLSNEIRFDSLGYSTFLIHPQLNKRTKRIGPPYYQAGSNCWLGIVGSFPPYSDYVEGLGGGYYNDYNVGVGTGYYKLVYYNKGGITWGTPLNINCNLGTSISKIANEENNISVYPNPVLDQATILIQNFLPSDNWYFELCDLTGKKLRSKKIQDNQFILNRTNLSSGIYFYQIENKMTSKRYTGKIIFE